MTGDVPCDVLNNAGQLCVSAHSTVRQFVSSYLGNLYQLRRSGIRPQKPGYLPMQKQGSVILGISGDNSAQAGGRFYEGVIANGAATAETLEAVQASIVAAGYGQ